MTLIVLDPDDDRGSVRLFDDPVSRELLGHQHIFGVLLVSDALRVISGLVTDPAFPLEARRRAVEWLRQRVPVTVAPH